MFGVNYGQTKTLVDLISIGIVGEDNREYYAISKEFNLEEAWNRFEVVNYTTKKLHKRVKGEIDTYKEYWIRENVLKPIYNELSSFHISDIPHTHFGGRAIDTRYLTFSYKSLKWLLDKYGKTNKQIAEEIKKFTSPVQNMDKNIPDHWQVAEQFKIDRSVPQFYAYYGAFDYVAFSQIFGGFESYPKSFPQYFIDLKQELDKEAIKMSNGNNPNLYPYSFDEALKVIKSVESYPKQANEHHALSDSKFVRDLHEFLNTL
jgi:hypothetical protein